MSYSGRVPFSHIAGQAPAVATLTRALEGGQVHHAYRFEGIDGVGKEMAAMAYAQALLCTGGVAVGCGECDACRRAGELSEDFPQVPRHPDFVLIGRAVYPQDVIGKSENTQISVQQIRKVVLARAGYAPHEGRAQVFLIRAAGELSNSAANALLKTLEEPRPDVHFVLLCTRPDQLISTIRSRTVPVRFAPLSDEVLTKILREHGVSQERIGPALELAGGSAARALEVADEELSAERDDFVRSVLEAVRAKGIGAAVSVSEARGSDRKQLMRDLEALAAALARRSRGNVASEPHHAHIDARRHSLVGNAITSLEGNASGNLTLSSLIVAMRAVR
ncbi:hypothetical protein JYT22_00530 [Endomicrobium sp. AH-315-J14]|nr:hypothetical protein [Endomicrobium sp. AH-315-J14]